MSLILILNAYKLNWIILEQWKNLHWQGKAWCKSNIVANYNVVLAGLRLSPAKFTHWIEVISKHACMVLNYFHWLSRLIHVNNMVRAPAKKYLSIIT